MPLSHSFYARPTVVVARELIGKILVTASREGRTSGRIVETEAYGGESDPASHAYRGPSRRNAVMFGPAGYLYVYLSYGVHYCCNVVTESEGVAGAVLIRALEPLSGVALMQERRGFRPLRELCNGPGKLCQALGIDLTDYGTDLEGSSVWIEDDGFRPPEPQTSARIGISSAVERPYRFFVAESSFVSPRNPSRAAGTGTSPANPSDSGRS